MVRNRETDSADLRKGLKKDRITVIELQYAYVPIPQHECNYYASQAYTNKKI